ncbi:MAG TPA: TetR/AcrR family transcriptional regulator [Solirubrobacter sp.]|jgi:AcrR family transcriptional regulator|nr:TetR/AcrR family transcriptional regulator [Solirubrobacter sp.]
MGRRVDTDRRAALLDAAATHLIEHGIAKASLEAIAATAGTSARMLVHHFGTRDALIAGALQIARRRQLAHAQEHFKPGPDPAAVLTAAWPWLVDAETRKYFRLFQQVAALETLQERDHPSELRTRLATDWRPMLRAVFAGCDDPEALADLLIAVYRGLATELVIGSDEAELKRAYERFIKGLAL